MGGTYFSVANLANPSLYKKIRKGSQLVTNTYILISNLIPSISNGYCTKEAGGDGEIEVNMDSRQVWKYISLDMIDIDIEIYVRVVVVVVVGLRCEDISVQSCVIQDQYHRVSE